MTRLTDNFTLEELTRSQLASRHGIDNTPRTKWVRENLTHLAGAILQPVRDRFRRPVIVSSGYRSPELERVLKGKPAGWLSSGQHPKGQAADFEVAGIPNRVEAEWIRDELDFDQVILEFYDPADPAAGWVHCSAVRPNRGQALTAARSPQGGTVYNYGLPGEPAP